MNKTMMIALLGALSIQSPAMGAPAPPPPDARTAAPVDLTGQWVSVITEDWRWRMTTPPKGDVASVPLNPEGRRVAGEWDLAADNAAGNQCRAFGAGGYARNPGRIRISWADADTLKLETDAGEQTRLYQFIQPDRGGIAPALTRPFPLEGERTWQGEIHAQWYKHPQVRQFGGAPQTPGGALRAVTRHARAGYLRKNGVPYSEDAVISEQFNVFPVPGGDTWLVITTIVDDPAYLDQRFVTSTNFKKEAGPAGWNPRPCATREPVGEFVPPPQGP